MDCSFMVSDDEVFLACGGIVIRNNRDKKDEGIIPKENYQMPKIPNNHSYPNLTYKNSYDITGSN